MSIAITGTDYRFLVDVSKLDEFADVADRPGAQRAFVIDLKLVLSKVLPHATVSEEGVHVGKLLSVTNDCDCEVIECECWVLARDYEAMLNPVAEEMWASRTWERVQ